MIARDYANLAPDRFRRYLALLILALAAVSGVGLALRYLASVHMPGDEVIFRLLLAAIALDFLIWPNNQGVSPLAARVVGGCGVLVLLITSSIYIIRHT